jgi:hypothetical protein
MAQRRLCHYFQEHPITVVSCSPLLDIICKREATRRVTKWAVEIGVFSIKYTPRTAIKSQALADFIVDWMETQEKEPRPDTKFLSLHFDGSKMYAGSGAGVVLTSPKGDKLRYMLQLHFACTINIVEYEALLHGLRVTKEMGISRIYCYGDSDLVVQQVSGKWDTTDSNMAAYR